MGSFRLANSIPHLDGKFNFIGSRLETVGKSLHHSCTSELTHKEFRYLRTLIVEPPFIEITFSPLLPKSVIDFVSKGTKTLTLQHWADLRPIHHLTIQQSCVFSKQSLPPFCDASKNIIFESTLYPEVTESICRSLNLVLPSPQFIQLTYRGGFSTFFLLCFF